MAVVAMASRAANTCSKLMPSSVNSVVLESPFLNVADLVKLQLSLGQWPRPYSPAISMPRTELAPRMRSQINLPGSEVRFVALLGQILPDQMPQSYVESYGLLKRKALNYYPRRPRVILTANAHVQNEGFKIWAASCRENGAAFVGAQHGGFEGMGKWYALEDHQKKIWDRYYTWGWKDASAENTKPLPSFKLIPATKINHDSRGRILMVNNTFIRYSYFMQSMPVGSSGYESYLSDIFAFLHALEDAPRDLVTVRPYPHDYAYGQQERFQKEFPRIGLHQGKTSMLDQMRRCRLFIGNNNTTAYLEAFTAGIPAVLFWNPNHWEVRDSARPYFDELLRCGILHYTPASAAELINRIYQDPRAWWERPEIRSATARFCDRFARTSENWLSEWKEELLAVEHGDKR
jgi:putative transferase (TIGR04331 family)